MLPLGGCSGSALQSLTLLPFISGVCSLPIVLLTALLSLSSIDQRPFYESPIGGPAWCTRERVAAEDPAVFWLHSPSCCSQPSSHVTPLFPPLLLWRELPQVATLRCLPQRPAPRQLWPVTQCTGMVWRHPFTLSLSPYRHLTFVTVGA